MELNSAKQPVSMHCTVYTVFHGDLLWRPPTDMTTAVAALHQDQKTSLLDFWKTSAMLSDKSCLQLYSYHCKVVEFVCWRNCLRLGIQPFSMVLCSAMVFECIFLGGSEGPLIKQECLHMTYTELASDEFHPFMPTIFPCGDSLFHQVMTPPLWMIQN